MRLSVFYIVGFIRVNLIIGFGPWADPFFLLGRKLSWASWSGNHWAEIFKTLVGCVGYWFSSDELYFFSSFFSPLRWSGSYYLWCGLLVIKLFGSIGYNFWSRFWVRFIDPISVNNFFWATVLLELQESEIVVYFGLSYFWAFWISTGFVRISIIQPSRSSNNL